MATLYAETCRDIGLRPARAPRERDPERWLTIKQAAARLGVSAPTLRKLVNDGELAYVDVGGGRERRSMRFTPQDIEAFLAKRRGTACRSRSVASSGTTSLNIGVIDFGALRAARASTKPKSSSAPSGKRRRKRTNVIKLQSRVFSSRGSAGPKPISARPQRLRLRPRSHHRGDEQGRRLPHPATHHDGVHADLERQQSARPHAFSRCDPGRRRQGDVESPPPQCRR